MKLRRITRLASLVAGLTLLVSSSRGQTPGALDPAFTTGIGPSNEVRSAAVQPDGKILLGGRFADYDEVSRIGIARINANGSLDTTFNPGAGVSGQYLALGVYAIAVQADGKIIIGGSFESVNGAPHVNLARLNADGSVDPTFNVTTSQGILELVRAVAIQADGKILLGGAFDTVNGVAAANLARLNTDGSLDTGFNSGEVAGDTQRFVAAIGLQPDGKIVLGGKMRNSNIIRLNPNGSLDASFDLENGPDSTVYALAIQADGKIAIGGSFQSFGDSFRFSIARVNTDGTLDTGYKPNLGTGNFTVFALGLQSDGKLIVGGDGNDDTIPGIGRFNPDGSLDTAYTGSTEVANDSVNAIQIIPGSNSALIAGRFGVVDNVSVNSVALLLSGPLGVSHPPFFTGEVALANGVYFLQFPSGNPFGYYSYLADSNYIFHFDLGYEYVFNAADGNAGVYLYDFASNGFFYTSPAFRFPYLYDFTLNTVLYYFPDPNSPGHYNTNGVRYFVRLDTGEIFSK